MSEIKKIKVEGSDGSIEIVNEVPSPIMVKDELTTQIRVKDELIIEVKNEPLRPIMVKDEMATTRMVNNIPPQNKMPPETVQPEIVYHRPMRIKSDLDFSDVNADGIETPIITRKEKRNQPNTNELEKTSNENALTSNTTPPRQPTTSDGIETPIVTRKEKRNQPNMNELEKTSNENASTSNTTPPRHPTTSDGIETPIVTRKEKRNQPNMNELEKTRNENASTSNTTPPRQPTTSDGIETPIVTRKEKRNQPNLNELEKSSDENSTTSNITPPSQLSNIDAPRNDNTQKAAITDTVVVKTEVADNLSDEFLDKLMEDVDGIITAATSGDNKAKIRVKTEKILNENYEERSECDQEDLKKLRSQLLQELEENKTEEVNEHAAHSSSKSKKKKEKSKSKEKKAKKRERSRSRSPLKIQLSEEHVSPNESPIWQRRTKIEDPPIFHRREYSPSEPLQEYKRQEIILPTLPLKRIKLEKGMPKCSTQSKETPTSSAEKIIPKTKREQALICVAAALNEFRKLGKVHESPSPFIYTSTVRKLPTSNSCLTQQIYDNRSPLHTIQNVSYEFNSNTNSLNLHNWGLKSMPERAIKVAHLLSIDAYTLHEKLLRIQLPSAIKKLKSVNKLNEETVDQSRSVLYANAMTQTDSTQYAKRHKTSDIGVQTLRTSETSISAEMPLNSLIQHLNEYQLLALNDFAELLRDPGNLANDVYQLRQRLLDIYKTASDRPTTVQQSSMRPPLPNDIPIRHNHSHLDANAHSYIPTIGAHTQTPHTHSRVLDPRLRKENVYNTHHQQPNKHQLFQTQPHKDYNY